MRLMIDQVRSLNNRAAILSSNKGIDKDLVATAKEVSSEKYFLLYILLYTAPEAVVEDHCWRIHFLLYHRVNLFYVLKNHARPDTINTRPSRRPSVQLETDRPGVEASYKLAANVQVQAS